MALWAGSLRKLPLERSGWGLGVRTLQTVNNLDSPRFTHTYTAYIHRQLIKIDMYIYIHTLIIIYIYTYIHIHIEKELYFCALMFWFIFLILTRRKYPRALFVIFIFRSIYLSIHLSVCLFVFLSLSLAVRLSFCLTFTSILHLISCSRHVC